MIKQNTYCQNLIKVVIDSSEAATWKLAVLEWNIVDCEEDEELESSCVCGKENLRYLFTIENNINGNALFPIGSSCIRKFDRGDLNEVATIREHLFKLLRAIESGGHILLSPKYFSRKLIAYLYDNGVFRANCYNDFNPHNDYCFLLDMFNKRDKASVSQSQNRKIDAIILNSIKPFLRNMLLSKIKKKNYENHLS